MAGKRKSTLHLKPPSREQVLLTIQSKEASLRDKALMAILWLTGARIREIIPNKSEIPIRKRINGERVITSINKRDWLGLERSQFEVWVNPVNHKTYFLIKDIPTEKRKFQDGLILRTVPINYEDEKAFIDYIGAYFETIPEHPSTKLFTMSRYRAWQIVKSFNSDWYCHFLRHARMTDLAKRAGLRDRDLQLITAWKDPRPSHVYVHLDWKDVANKL